MGICGELAIPEGASARIIAEKNFCLVPESLRGDSTAARFNAVMPATGFPKLQRTAHSAQPEPSGQLFLATDVAGAIVRLIRVNPRVKLVADCRAISARLQLATADGRIEEPSGVRKKVIHVHSTSRDYNDVWGLWSRLAATVVRTPFARHLHGFGQ